MTCTKCKAEIQPDPGHMCDRDPNEGLYCGPCFEELGCAEDHDEDCETIVWDDNAPSQGRIV